MSIRKVSVMLCSTVMAIGFMAYRGGRKSQALQGHLPRLRASLLSKIRRLITRAARSYFCCGDCPGAFKKDTAKYATKANHATGRHGPDHSGQMPAVWCETQSRRQRRNQWYVKVGFCCEKCQAKAKDAKGDAQVDLAFSRCGIRQRDSKSRRSKSQSVEDLDVPS